MFFGYIFKLMQKQIQARIGRATFFGDFYLFFIFFVYLIVSVADAF